MRRLTARRRLRALVSRPMSSKYYAHFTAPGASHRAEGEWCGIVELSAPLRVARERQELALVLACNLDLEVEEVRVLEWSRLH